MRPLSILICLCAVVLGAVLFAAATSEALSPMHVGTAALALGLAFAVKDREFIQTAALPEGAASTQTAGFDLGHNISGKLLAGCELVLDAPALATLELPDTKTVTYSIETDDNAAFASPTVLAASFLVQTGAGGAGAAAAQKKFRLPTGVERFVRVKATGVATVAAQTKTMTVSMVF